MKEYDRLKVQLMEVYKTRDELFPVRNEENTKQKELLEEEIRMSLKEFYQKYGML